MDDHNQDLIKQLFQFNSLMQHYYGNHIRSLGPFDNPQRGQALVLTILRTKPELTQKELRTILDVRNQSLGELLSKLERHEFIVRYPSEHDRRLLNIKLTEKGKEVADQLQHKIDSISAIFNCFNQEEKETFQQLMKTLIIEMKQHHSDDECEEH